MAGRGAGYDLSVATFSPDGRVFQVEYATKAVDQSPTVLAFVCKDGVLAAAEKPPMGKMTVPGTSPKIFAVDRHAFIAICGFSADGRLLVKRAREEATQYKKVFGELIPGKILAERIALYVHIYTVAWTIRPLGISIVIGVYDENVSAPASGFQLYGVEPSGTCYRYFGMSLGKSKQSAKTEIEKLSLSTLTCREGVFQASKILHQIQEDAKKEIRLEMMWISNETDRKCGKVPQDFLKEQEMKAIARLEELERE